MIVIDTKKFQIVLKRLSLTIIDVRFLGLSRHDINLTLILNSFILIQQNFHKYFRHAKLNSKGF